MARQGEQVDRGLGALGTAMAAKLAPRLDSAALLRSRPAQAAALIAIGLAADVAFDPQQRHIPLCPFRTVTGWCCPLCGCLRGGYALTRFDFAGALRDNALLIAALPFLAAYWVDWLARASVGLPRRRLTRGTRVWLVIIAVAFTVVRNLPQITGLRPG